MTQWLDANAQAGSKQYKALISSLEEMLSEPTWDYHNEELFALMIEHAAMASCLSENDRMRPKLLLEVVQKMLLATSPATLTMRLSTAREAN